MPQFSLGPCGAVDVSPRLLHDLVEESFNSGGQIPPPDGRENDQRIRFVDQLLILGDQGIDGFAAFVKSQLLGGIGWVETVCVQVDHLIALARHFEARSDFRENRVVERLLVWVAVNDESMGHFLSFLNPLCAMAFLRSMWIFMRGFAGVVWARFAT